MGYLKDIVVISIISIAIIGFILFYSGENHPIILFKPPTKYVSCYEKFQDQLDNISYYFSGINYTNPIAICIRDKEYSYCLGSEIEEYKTGFLEYHLIYFKSCYLQTGFYLKNYKEVIEIDKDYAMELLNSTDVNFIEYLKNGVKNGKITGLSKELLKALEEYYKK